MIMYVHRRWTTIKSTMLMGSNNTINAIVIVLTSMIWIRLATLQRGWCPALLEHNCAPPRYLVLTVQLCLP